MFVVSQMEAEILSGVEARPRGPLGGRKWRPARLRAASAKPGRGLLQFQVMVYLDLRNATVIPFNPRQGIYRLLCFGRV